jgi:hypothetical protein
LIKDPVMFQILISPIAQPCCMSLRSTESHWRTTRGYQAPSESKQPARRLDGLSGTRSTNLAEPYMLWRAVSRAARCVFNNTRAPRRRQPRTTARGDVEPLLACSPMSSAMPLRCRCALYPRRLLPVVTSAPSTLIPRSISNRPSLVTGRRWAADHSRTTSFLASRASQPFSVLG